MAQTSLVSYSHLRRVYRLDAEFFRPEYLQIEKLLSERNTKTLDQLKASVVSGPFGSTLKSSAYRQAGIPFVRISDLSSFFIDKDSLVYIDESDHERIKSSQLLVGDLVLSKVGNTIGVVSKVTTEIGTCNISENNIGINLRYLDEITKNYILVFLNCHYGQKQILRCISGNAQPKLNVSDIANVQIVLTNVEFRKALSKDVNTAQHLYYESAIYYSQAEQLLLSESRLQNWQPSHRMVYIRNYSQATQARRIDAEHFQPKYEELRAHIHDYPHGYLKMTDIATNSDETIEPHAQPEQDFDYIELAGINQVIGMVESIKKIKGKDAPSRARMLLRAGDVIASTVEGSLDKVALVSEEYHNAIGSTGFFILRPLTVASGYLLILAKSVVVKEQMHCESSGTILAAVPAKSLRNIIVPNVPSDKRDKIAEFVQQAHIARREAKAILGKAKHAVEIAIEENEEKAIEFINNG